MIYALLKPNVFLELVLYLFQNQKFLTTTTALSISGFVAIDPEIVEEVIHQ